MATSRSAQARSNLASRSPWRLFSLAMYEYSSTALPVFDRDEVMEMLGLGATGVITTGATAGTAGVAEATGAGSSATAADGDFRVRNAQVLMARTIAMPQDPTSR